MYNIHRYVYTYLFLYILPPASNGLFEAPTHWSQNKKLVVVRRRIGASHARLHARRRDSKHHRTGRKVAAADSEPP